MTDPSNQLFDWTIAACPSDQFRRLKNGVEECKRCFKPTIKGVYSSAVTDGDDQYKHGQCCTNPTHHVCRKMKAEYEDRCSCTDPANAHCFDSFDPYGVNVLHLDLSILENTGLPTGYDRNSMYVALLSVEGSATPIPMPVVNQMTTIDCTGALGAWCQSFIPSCTTPLDMGQHATIGIASPQNTAETTWSGQFTATILNRAGDAGDVTFTIVEYVANQVKIVEFAGDLAALDAWQLANNIKQCFTPVGETCPVESRRRLAETFAGRSRRRRLLGGGNRRGNCRL